MKERGKILLYINSISRYNYGNLHSNLQLMEGFIEKGFDVVFVVNKRTPDDVNVPVRVVELQAKGDFDRPFKLAKVIREENPTAVISNMYVQILTTALAKRFLGENRPKLIGVCRDVRNWHRRWWKLPFRLFVKKVFESMDWMVAISESVKRDMRKTFFVKEDKIKLIYNPVNVEKIRKLSEEPIEEDSFFRERQVLCVVGRLEEQKAPEVALSIFELLKEKLNNVGLCFVGSGSMERRLIAEVEDKALTKDVLFTGFQENPFKYIAKSKLLLHTAVREGLGRVVMESLALGVPVVALYNEHSGYRELLHKSGGGILVPHGKTDEAVKKIKEILSNEELYFSLKDKALKSIELFDRKRIIGRYINLLGR